MENTQREMNGGQRGLAGPGGPGVDPEKLATFLGVSADNLHSEFSPDKNLVDVAAAHGKSTSDLRAFLIEQATARIDEQLAAGKTATAV